MDQEVEMWKNTATVYRRRYKKVMVLAYLALFVNTLTILTVIMLMLLVQL